MKKKKNGFVIIDLFCGAGGTSFGFHSAEMDGQKFAEVVACVNHDPLAIKSHLKNFPGCLHFTEDVRLLDVSKLPRKQPGDKRIWILWASLECTHFSNAKTGSRDADSRTLAHALFPYIDHINPDLIKIENVREFKSWGPLIPKVVKAKGDVGAFCPLVLTEEPARYGVPITKAKGKVGAHCKVAFDKATGTFGPKVLKRKGDVGERCKLAVVETKHVFGPHMIPENRTKGEYYVEWVNKVESMGYRYKSTLLNSADFGAYQSRTRYFGVFAKPEMPIIFPKATHDRHGRNGLEKWKAVREVLELDTVGESIFNRKKRLSDNTFRRVLAGLLKFVATEMSDEYLVRAYGGDPQSKVTSLESPAPTVTTIPHESLVHVKRGRGFMIQYNGRPDKSVRPINEPCGTVTTKDRFGMMSCVFMDNQFGTGVPSSVDEPCHALTTVPKSKVVKVAFMDNQFGNSKPTSLDEPCRTITTTPKSNLVSASFLMPTNYGNEPTSLDAPAPTITANRKWHYLVNPQFGWPAVSIEKPCFTLIAKMDKRPPYLLSVEPSEAVSATGTNRVEYYRDDTICPEMRIRAFMEDYGIEDIFMRMLEIIELKRIQGFPESYILLGPKDQQKKFIGNAVVPQVVAAWAKAYFREVNKMNTTPPPAQQLQLFYA